ncbi:MAG: biopolymer transporter ExbD [Myxococcota bacterium]
MGGRKQVDQEVPLVPFIDLLFCVIMFLLAVAVWNPAARIEAWQKPESGAAPAPEAPPRLALHVRTSGYVLASEEGLHLELPKAEAGYDEGALALRLRELARTVPPRLEVKADDGVHLGQVVRAMDVALGAGFPAVVLGTVR